MTPDLPQILYEMRPPNFCLFTGDLEPDMAYVAPYLVRLVPKTPFTDWILKEFWGKNRGIFVHSKQPIEKMRTHFRALVTAYDERGNPMTFRFYDPRVMRRYLPTCNSGELKIFFGDIEAYFAESEENEVLTKYEIGETGLKQTALPIN